MNLNKVAKSPYFQAILFQMESRIVRADNKASQEGITLNDSQIKSALVKAAALTKGKKPKIEGENPRDVILAGLIHDLAHRQEKVGDDEDGETNPIPARDWFIALEQVRDSVKRRSGGASGSRAYLEFIKDFIPDA
jgi:hypothetical protein